MTRIALIAALCACLLGCGKKPPVDTITNIVGDLGSSSKGLFVVDGPQSPVRGMNDVRDFGAKGDGKTDDSAAFQRAIYASPPSHEAQVYAELKFICKNRGLTYQIQCDAEGLCFGVAKDAGWPVAFGFTDITKHVRHNPTAAAEALVNALRPPTFDTGEVRP